ncbi:MAG: PIN domain-containing protein [Acidobacteriota bacterium]|nr:PIN domain-containing protein [Acidobacteriota bacterium]
MDGWTRVIAVDTNILVHAHRRGSPKHAAARRRIVALAEGARRWGIPVFCLGEFLRVVTHPRLLDPHSADRAGAALQRVLASPSVELLLPGRGFPTLLLEAIREAGAIGNLVFDAQIVALCREAGVSTLLTEDRDFDRFSGFATERLG